MSVIDPLVSTTNSSSAGGTSSSELVPAHASPEIDTMISAVTTALPPLRFVTVALPLPALFPASSPLPAPTPPCPSAQLNVQVPPVLPLPSVPLFLDAQPIATIPRHANDEKYFNISRLPSASHRSNSQKPNTIQIGIAFHSARTTRVYCDFGMHK